MLCKALRCECGKTLPGVLLWWHLDRLTFPVVPRPPHSWASPGAFLGKVGPDRWHRLKNYCRCSTWRWSEMQGAVLKHRNPVKKRLMVFDSHAVCARTNLQCRYSGLLPLSREKEKRRRRVRLARGTNPHSAGRMSWWVPSLLTAGSRRNLLHLNVHTLLLLFVSSTT